VTCSKIPPPPTESRPQISKDSEFLALEKKSMQSTFQYACKEDCHIHGPLPNNSTYQKFRIITEWLLSHNKIDQDDTPTPEIRVGQPVETVPALPEMDEDSENDDEGVDLDNPPAAEIGTKKRDEQTQTS
jgi:hypothetical protein